LNSLGSPTSKGRIVFHFLTQLGDLVGVSQDPATRGIFALIICIALYGVFILRDK
jgi:hypothetical protein